MWHTFNVLFTITNIRSEFTKQSENNDVQPDGQHDMRFLQLLVPEIDRQTDGQTDRRTNERTWGNLQCDTSAYELT